MAEPLAKRSRGRPRLAPEAQRQRLFDAAIRAIEKRGYEFTRISDIVREAGMSSRAFYELFSSKEDLVAEYVERAAGQLVKELQEVWAAAPGPIERIERGVQAFRDVLPGIRIDLDALGGEAGRRAHHARRSAVREVSRLVLEDFERAQREGRMPELPDPMAIELALTGLETLSLRYFAEGRTDELARLGPIFVRLLIGAGLTPSE